MLLATYRNFIINIFIMFKGIQAFTVAINASEAGLLGENGTDIECLYTRNTIPQVISVSFMAFNRSSTSFDQIATYLPNQSPLLTRQGQYLKGRVTLTTITQSSTKAVIAFNNLMCIDETFYKCKVNYLDVDGKIPNKISNNISISVQVPPSKPDSVSIMNTPAYDFLTSAKHMEDRTSPPSKENETLSDLELVTPNDTTSFNNSTLPKNNYNATSATPSDATYTTQHTKPAKGIAEGDNITVICRGHVGKPPGEYVFKKYRSGNILSMTYTATETNVSEIADKCSYYRTSRFTFQVTAKDNNASIRCVVNSFLPEFDKLYIETVPIEVNSDTSTLPSSSTGTSSGTGEKHGNQKKDLKPGIIGAVAAVVFLGLLGLLCYYLLKKKRPTSHQPVIYAEVNKATQLKNRQETSNQQDDDTYAGTQEGIYDQPGNRRHKENENAEQFDKIGDIKEQNSTDDTASSVKSNQKGSYVNQALNKGEKQVATVPPISRSSAGSHGYEQTSELSQKGYENVKGTDNTHTSTGQSIDQTSF